MDNSKKIKHTNLTEGESPEENNILDDLQVLVNLWRDDNLKSISPIVSLQKLIDDYYSKPLTEMVGGDQEWHTKEQGEFFTLDGSENLGNSDYFKDDGFDIIHQSSGEHHLSDISPESEETYIPKGSKKIKKTVLKPQLNKGPFNISISEQKEDNDNIVSGGETYMWNSEEKTHTLTRPSISKERFFQLVKSISVNISKEELNHLDGADLYDIENALSHIVKLYGTTITELGGMTSDSLVFKLLLTSLDNYEGLVNNEITNFDSLKLRTLKTYRVYLEEDVSVYRRYYWEPIVNGYSEKSVEAVVHDNEDGSYAYYEWDTEPGYKVDDGDYDSEGVDIVDVEEIQSTPLTESKEYGMYGPKLTEIGAILINHLIKEYSNDELEILHRTNPYNFPANLLSIMKLYSLDDTHRVKKLIQLMANNNWEKVDYKKFIGNDLPQLISYTFMKSFEETETQIKSAIIEINDTNWESAVCSANNEFWDWDPEQDYLETVDTDFTGNEEWESIEVNGKEVWRAGENNKYNPINPENC